MYYIKCIAAVKQEKTPKWQENLGESLLFDQFSNIAFQEAWTLKEGADKGFFTLLPLFEHVRAKAAGLRGEGQG